jgi:hypothetical protein
VTLTRSAPSTHFRKWHTWVSYCTTPGDVPTWPRDASRQSKFNRIASTKKGHDDWGALCDLVSSYSGWRISGDEYANR